MVVLRWRSSRAGPQPNQLIRPRTCLSLTMSLSSAARPAITLLQFGTSDDCLFLFLGVFTGAMHDAGHEVED